MKQGDGKRPPVVFVSTLKNKPPAMQVVPSQL